jgi:Ca2+-transporting ATPase
MAAPTATVLRDGTEVKIPAREVVPGDVVILHTGDRIPADARLIESNQSADRGSRVDG